MASPVEKVKVRGLAHLCAGLFGLWGAVVSAKALYDLLIGEPEANLYSAEKWQFVTQEQWLRYAGFELAYGAALLALAWAVYRYARFLPVWVERPKAEPDIRLFE